MCNYYDRHRDPRNLQAMFRFPELPNMEPRYIVRPTNAFQHNRYHWDAGRTLRASILKFVLEMQASSLS
jgi:hypothetical protein